MSKNKKKFKKVDEKFSAIEIDMEVGIDGMLVNETKKISINTKNFYYLI